eukprot:jgi/Bigna1/44123/e_gw1.89.68.1
MTTKSLEHIRFRTKDQWVPDYKRSACWKCRKPFTVFRRRHHCRLCGEIFCDSCSNDRVVINKSDPGRTCRECY